MNLPGLPLFGQNKLIATLDSFTVADMPRAMLFIGKAGCGKRYIAKYLATKLELDTIDISTDVTPEELTEYLFFPTPRLYLIDLRNFTEKAQNTILKFIEEPSENMRLVLLANSTLNILPTIKNRCTMYTFEAYTKEDLSNFAWMHSTTTDLFCDFCNTPGSYIDNDPETIESMHEMCAQLILNIKQLSYPILLAYSCNINLKDDYDRFDPLTFLNMMHYTATDIFKSNNLEAAFKVMQITAEFLYNYAMAPTIAMDSYIIYYLTTLYEEVTLSD